jgi:rare lipoprotein A
MGKNMGLKTLLMICIVVFLPACTAVKVEQTSAKLIPSQVKKSLKVTQIQVQPELRHSTLLRNDDIIQQAYQSLLLTSPTSRSQQKPLAVSHIQEGKASYYSSALHGRKTASGETYNENKLTAAHKHLPFGTKVRVFNKKNGRSVLVSINDRGPFVKKRILDLSYFAAKQLGMIRAGITNIKMEVLQ